MTSASELFYTRRSRVGRPDPDSGIGSSMERSYHRRNHLSHHNNRHDLDDGDSLRRSSHVRHFSSRACSLSERSSVQFDEYISELASSNGLNVDSVSSSRRQSLVSRNVLNANSVSSSRSQSLVLSNGLNADSVSSSRRQSLRSNERLARARFDEGTSELLSSNGLNVDGVSNVSGRSLSADERLPGAVLLARARLLERLRGVSVSANRRSSRTPRNAYRWEYVSDDDLRTVSEISTVLTARSTRLTSETERFQLLHETSKKPPGLTQEAVDRLVSEVFSSQEVDVERKTSRDCGICLESFREDDVLTRLLCGHRFHFGCLDPWVRTCGDCPYCRRSVL